MEIVQIIDSKLKRSYLVNILKGSRDYFIFINSQYNILIWPGGEIKLKRCFSNKRLGNLKVRNIRLSEHPIRTILSVLRNGYIPIKGEEDSWYVRHSDKISVGKWKETINTFSRAII